MQIKAKLMRWIGATVLVATTTGALSGCYVQTRRPHYHHHARAVVIVR